MDADKAIAFLDWLEKEKAYLQDMIDNHNPELEYIYNIDFKDEQIKKESIENVIQEFKKYVEK